MDDPHVHVEWTVPDTSADTRAVTASVFGLVADAPRTVRTGCDTRVPYASTSPHPERVTCLPCREHARDRHLRYAATIEQSAALLGGDHVRAALAAARRMRDVADRFT
ncbi:hypothetical protein I6A84_39435 [Frankia sp. CNm7]|uniref:Uncharacterized protein n=1 Tax=Frankia nepalensis TaxID=1836974 RepID=A0A937UQG4_9ACTN|nr:hypothetical protein [Frankia nepalensis]MBL7495588.1 hypothetical protein [Frankia nepalensis]MBL7508834.1 hypothetical protein [Frankia nepalensis]MBL7523961.1 hypothetical protein [Frankia nepalensis]MBL7630058.1 hypothetical protein [Frankia nepalensis]